MGERARLQQSCRAQRRLAHQDARPEADAAGEMVRLGDKHGAQFEARVADGEAIAESKVKPRQQSRIGRDAIGAVALGERVG